MTELKILKKIITQGLKIELLYLEADKLGKKIATLKVNLSSLCNRNVSCKHVHMVKIEDFPLIFSMGNLPEIEQYTDVREIMLF